MRMRWKLLGLAGVAGVAATGAVGARKRREHQDMTPDEVRERLHSRLADISREDGPSPADPDVAPDA